MDYGYVNARIRGMKSRLLSKKALDDLVFKPDLEALIAELEKTVYKDEILEAKSQYSGVICIENALRANYVKTFRKILSFTEGGDAARYMKIFLSRWDVQNIKTILRGKNIHVTNEEILDCLVPAGELDHPTLVDLVRQPDVRAVIDLLATWDIGYAKPLTEKYPSFIEHEDLAILECVLDRYYYAHVLDEVTGNSYNEILIRNLITTEIDVVNIKTLLKMTRDKVSVDDARDYFLDGGKELNVKDLIRLLSLHSLGGVLEALKATPFRFLAEVPETVVTSEKMSAFEKKLEKYLVTKGISAFQGEPLSIASSIGYFWAKHNEMTNIRIISRCKTADLSEEDLREELVYV